MTQNQMVMKFVSTKKILDGFVEVKNRNEAENIPLAKAIFEKFDFAK
mgnify:FL=1